MIITKTPFRISFFGAGTDYPAWYNEHGGSVLVSTIDKYCYLSVRSLPPFFQHRNRIVYSKIETVKEVSNIKHPVVRAVLEQMNALEGLEIHHDGDIPARTGLGSSSAFTVGLINAIRALRGELISPKDLAEKAIFIEREVIGEDVGSQDQVAVAFGGLNKIDFAANGSFKVSPIILKAQRFDDFQNHLMLFFTGLPHHTAGPDSLRLDIEEKKSDLLQSYKLVDEAVGILQNEDIQMEKFGELLHRTWSLHRRIINVTADHTADEFYQKALDAGATGGKLLGSEEGGFLLLWAKPSIHENLKAKLGLTTVDFRFEPEGSKVVVYNP